MGIKKQPNNFNPKDRSTHSTNSSQYRCLFACQQCLLSLGTGGSPGVDMVDSTHEVGGGVAWGGDDNILCTCTHCWCYATSCFLHLHTWSVLRNIMFPALAHMVGATQHHVLDQNSINLFRRLVGDEVCKERCDSYVLTAGDNCAEGLCVVSKKQLRRTNLNIAVVQDKIQHRYLLSSHFLNKAPGLARIMQALRCHKMKCISGLVSPTDAFKKPLWQLWLTCSKKKGWLSCC